MILGWDGWIIWVIWDAGTWVGIVLELRIKKTNEYSLTFPCLRGEWEGVGGGGMGNAYTDGINTTIEIPGIKELEFVA